MVYRRTVRIGLALPASGVAFLFAFLGLIAVASDASRVEAAGSGVDCVATPDDPSCMRRLPLRWCALEGSTAADNPAALGDANTSLVLWRRHERPSDSVYIPNARITFRSALWAAAQANQFPIIRAADLDSAGVPANSPLRNGDVDTSDVTQVELLNNVCNMKWENDVAPAFPGQSLAGVPAINVRRILSGALGVGYYAAYDFGASGLADDVNTPERFVPVRFLVADLDEFWDVLTPASYHECETEMSNTTSGWGTIVGHELGHTLGLGDNVGADDIVGTGDEPDNLMTSGLCSRNLGTNIRDSIYSSAPGGPFLRTIPDQVDWMKRASRNGFWPGADWDPPGVVIPGAYQSFVRSDDLGDVPADEPFVDLASLEVAERTDVSSTILTFGLRDFSSPVAGALNYWVLADLDLDHTTGGAASDLPPDAPATTFDGAEFLARIQVTPGPLIVPTLWRWDGTAFVQSSSEFIEAARKFEGAQHAAAAPFQYLTVSFPSSERGPTAATFRVEALAHNTTTGTVDRLPLGPDVTGDGIGDEGQIVSLVPPMSPACGATPAQARRGENVVVDIAGLLPEAGVHVNLGGLDLATGMTDIAGSASIAFVVPADALPGPHLLTAGNLDTALTADCLLEVIDVESCAADSDCAPGQFCQRERGLCQADGFCAAQPTECPDTLAPVCGCDGMTYRNECEAARLGISVDFGGQCLIVLGITLTPLTAENRIGENHTVTAEISDLLGIPQPGIPVKFRLLSGPNAGASGLCSINADCTTDASGRVRFTYRGLGGVGTDQIQACFVDAAGNSVCSEIATKTWVNTPPIARCSESVNPAGKNVPPAGGRGRPSGQNQDGFFRLDSRDAEDGTAPLFVTNVSGSATLGPFASGTVIKLTEAPGATPSSKPMGGPHSAVAVHITLDSDAIVFAVDSVGAISERVACRVPPSPN